MGTIEKYFLELPEPYKTKALKNTLDSTLKWKVSNMAEALYYGFFWEDTTDGYNYWYDLHLKYI